MELSDAQALAHRLMQDCGLVGWTYGTNKRKKTLGLCFSQIKRIELSKNFIAYNSEALVRETLLHEIAHALVGTEHGHDSVWKAMAVKVGASAHRTTSNVKMPLGKWQATCAGCGVVFSRHRKPKHNASTICRRCGPEPGLLFYRKAEPEPSESERGSKRLPSAAHLVESKSGTSKSRTSQTVKAKSSTGQSARSKAAQSKSRPKRKIK